MAKTRPHSKVGLAGGNAVEGQRSAHSEEPDLIAGMAHQVWAEVVHRSQHPRMSCVLHQYGLWAQWSQTVAGC